VPCLISLLLLVLLLLLLLLLLFLVDVWGLDKDGNFHNEDSNDQLLATSQEGTAGLVPVTSHSQQSLVSFTTRTKNVKCIASIIQKEMEILQVNLKKEQIRLTNRNRSSNIRKGGESSRLSSSLVGNEQFLNKRLLFLFQRDLLPGITGEILENKDKRDNYHNNVNVVSIYWKYAR
jgi:hypothetical protein